MASTANDLRRSASLNRARSEAISEGHRRNRRWAREHPGQRDEVWFKREIAPKLDAFTLAEIATVTGLSLAACSRIRAGAECRTRGIGRLCASSQNCKRLIRLEIVRSAPKQIGAVLLEVRDDD